jgi:(1->4)-alpha-D-glucan 1-alpha-D-glucosylmutase
MTLFVSQQLLQLRANLPQLFATGDYIPLNAEGTAGNHVVAFLRRSEDTSVLVVVPRLALKLERERKGENPWADTQLPLPATMHQYRWRNVLEPAGRTLTTDDGQLSMADLFTSLPVAVLVADDTEETA